jgi:hypothetical protein
MRVKMSKKVVVILGILATCLLFNLTLAHAGERFTDNGDGTVTDHLLGVMWGKTDNQGDIDWKSAQRWVKYTLPDGLPLEKRDNWRLPTIKELQSLYVDDKKYKGYETDCGQRVKIVPEIRLSCGWVWSSERKNVTARVFNFQKGYDYTDRLVHNRAYRALPVRNFKLGE